MKLSDEQESMVLAGARCVPDDRRDEYFRMVADTLRDERDARGRNKKSNRETRRDRRSLEMRRECTQVTRIRSAPSGD